MPDLLNVRDYAKRFYIHHLERALPVFEGLNFAVRPGQFLLVSGPNGIGKSTLLRCLYRTYKPTGGQALYHSRRGPIDLARAADVDIALLRREEIGMVSQFLRPRPRVSALELVAEPLLGAGSAAESASSGVGWEAAIRQAQALLSSFGLKPELWNAYPTTFSGGEQQKVNLARALIRPFRLLLLDEPTASLDRATRRSLTERLAELKAQGVAMIGIFHYPEEIQRLVDDEIPMRAAADLPTDLSASLLTDLPTDLSEDVHHVVE